DGTITTLAGIGPRWSTEDSLDYAGLYSGDGGPAASAALGSHLDGISVDGLGNIYFADTDNRAVRVLRPAKSAVVIGAMVDAASQSAGPLSPGKIVVIYGAGL